MSTSLSRSMGTALYGLIRESNAKRLGGAGSRCQFLCPDQWEHHSGYAVKSSDDSMLNVMIVRI